MEAQYEELKCEFPYIRALGLEFWNEAPYNTCPKRRCKIIILLGAMLNHKDFRDFVMQKQDALVKKIEVGCYNYTIRKTNEDNITCSWSNKQFEMAYNYVIHEKAYELNYNNNKYLMPLILDGSIDPYKLGGMNPEEMNPESNSKIIQATQERRTLEVKSKTSSLYTCEKCKKKAVYLDVMQTRSPDEAPDLKVTCSYCENTWFEKD